MKYDLAVFPIASAILNTGDTVTATVYLRGTSTTVAQTSNATVEAPAGSGKFNFTFNPVSKPAFGKYQYSVKFVGGLQTIWCEVDWEDERMKYLDASVYLDTVNGVAGNYYPNGTPYSPARTLAQAKVIMANYGFEKLRIRGGATLDSTVENFTIEGVGASNIIALANQNIAGVSWKNVRLTGQMNGFSSGSADLDTVTSAEGKFYDSSLYGSLAMKSGGVLNIIRGSVNDVWFNVTGNGFSVIGINCIGNVKLVANTDGIFIKSGEGNVSLQSGVTGGVAVVVSGIGQLTNNSVGGTVVNLLLPNANWQELSTAINSAGTAGELLNKIQNIFSKLPTNKFMGSSDVDNHDTDIDSILTRANLLDTKSDADARQVTNIAEHDATQSALGTAQGNVTDILADTNEIQGKLPTNKIMGSSDVDNHDTDIDSILADTNEIQGKLPTNKFMGSSDVDNHDTDIDSILTRANLLDTKSDADARQVINIAEHDATQSAISTSQGNVTDILADTNEIQGKLPTNKLMGSSDVDNHDTDIDAILTDTNSLNDTKVPGIVSVKTEDDARQVILVAEHDATQLAVGGVQTDVTTIKGKTDIKTSEVPDELLKNHKIPGSIGANTQHGVVKL